MNEIKIIIITLTVSFIVYGVVMLFSPSGEMGKMFKTVVGVALIFIIVFSLLNTDIELDTYKPETEEANVVDFNLNKMAVERSEEALENYIVTEMQKIGLNDIKVSVKMDISDDNCISIDCADVLCGKGEYTKADEFLKGLGIPYDLMEIKNE